VLFGFNELFAWQRIQIFGRGERALLDKFEAEGKTDTLEKFFSWELPCCVFTNGAEPTQPFFNAAESSHCAILQTSFDTSEFIARIMRILANVFAPKITIHGVLVEVYGLGILIMGESGAGKSEAALELIKLGHRLVADDVVEIHCLNGDVLSGAGANKIIAHHLEIRGLGVVNVTHLFGVRAIRNRAQIQLVVNLEEWDPAKNYDRFGGDDIYEEILGVKIPRIEIPVKPGRNIPTIIETAAMNERLKNMGYNAAKEFNHNILKWIESETARSVYFGEHDIT
jgi:HPr kinase/phosphorylase